MNKRWSLIYIVIIGAIMINISCSHKISIESLVCNANYNDVKRYLEKGGDPNHVANDGNTLLLLALTEGCRGGLKMAKLLIENGADVNKTSRYGRTPLMAAVNHSLVDVVTYFIGQGANVNTQDDDGITAAMSLANNKTDSALRIVKILEEKQANFTKKSKDGMTAIIWARQLELLDVVSYLESLNVK